MEKASISDYQTGLMKTAWALSIVTVIYNLGEGGISAFFGFQDETLALFGFGMDSFIEVISAIGIGHMIWRMKRNTVSKRDEFEGQALRITGASFYLLSIGLIIGAAVNIMNVAKPETTIIGIIVSLISILTMYCLYRYKLKIGTALNSDPIISDANCTKACFYLSFILLGSSGIYHLFNIPYIDAIGSVGIAWYALREGKEAFEKAKSRNLTYSDECC